MDIIDKLMETKAEAGDYVGEDGLLYCGKCHTPKQMRLDVNPATGEPAPTLVPTRCKCQCEADEERKRQEETEHFRDFILTLWEDEISSPDGLPHSFREDDGKEAKVSDACKRYVEHSSEMFESNIGILFYGSVGTGKSFFASCIGNALLSKRVPVAATNFPRLMNLLQGTREKQGLLDRLSVYKFLILDDLGVERDSGYSLEQMFNIVDARCNSRLPVIVTTNLTLEEMEHPTSMQYGRIYDRVLEMCPIRIKLAGESRRKGNAARREQLAREILFG